MWNDDNHIGVFDRKFFLNQTLMTKTKINFKMCSFCVWFLHGAESQPGKIEEQQFEIICWSLDRKHAHYQHWVK